jgi:hypothetical protein
MGSKIICRCGKYASICTYVRSNLSKNNVVGLILYSDSDQIDKYVNNYNKKSYYWIQNRFYQHIRLCKGSDRAVGLLALSFKDIFAKLTSKEINDPKLYNKNADEIKSRLVKIARDKFPYIFKISKEIRHIYGNKRESKLYSEISWTLVGRKVFGKRYNCGLLPFLYNLFQENLKRKVLIQIDIPDGSINYNGKNEYRYWDIRFHISSCGKIENDESFLDALLRETSEEIDLDLQSNLKNINFKCKYEGIHIFYGNICNFISTNYFELEENNWKGCYDCVSRYFKHKYKINQLHLTNNN